MGNLREGPVENDSWITPLPEGQATVSPTSPQLTQPSVASTFGMRPSLVHLEWASCQAWVAVTVSSGQEAGACHLRVSRWQMYTVPSFPLC